MKDMALAILLEALSLTPESEARPVPTSMRDALVPTGCVVYDESVPPLFICELGEAEERGYVWGADEVGERFKKRRKK